MSIYQFSIQSSSSPYSSIPMSVSGIQGQLLEVTVVGCNKLKDTEWISRQDPYVCLEYANTKHRTRTHTDGGKNPTFQEKFVLPLIEGLREINVYVWNSNSVTYDDFIGEGKVQLQKVLAQGYDDGAWSLQTKTGRYAGEVRLIMHYTKPNKPATSYAPTAPPYGAPPASPYAPQAQMYAPPPPAAYPAPSPYPSYPPNLSYPPNPAPAGYPPSPYGPPRPAAYPPAPYPPTSIYPPPPSSAYPPPPQASSFYPPPPGPYGVYPPPPY